MEHFIPSTKFTISNPRKEAKEFLEFLLRNGSFYYSAIELDIYSKEKVNGENIESKIKELLKTL